MRNTNLDHTSTPFFHLFPGVCSFPPASHLLFLSLQQMALVRGGQVTDDPVTPPRAPEPCPAPAAPLPLPSLSCHQPPPLLTALWIPPALSALSSAPVHHPTTPLCSSVSPTPPLLPHNLSPPSPLLWAESGGPAHPSSPPVVQAFWTEQMVREGQEETSSNLGAQPDLAHSECLMLIDLDWARKKSSHSVCMSVHMVMCVFHVANINVFLLLQLAACYWKCFGVCANLAVRFHWTPRKAKTLCGSGIPVPHRVCCQEELGKIVESLN